MYKYKNLTKRQFLEKNERALIKQINYVNLLLDEKYLGNATDLTQADFWALLNCEAGLKNGKVAPNHRHSEGERGLFPLPSNVRYWNGSDAPAWDKPMPLEVNIHHFMLYLGNLKNKVVTTRHSYTVYSGFFEIDGIENNSIISARVLAGVVHGYFSGARYNDRKAPYDYLVKHYKKQTPMSQMMENTKYIHAGKPLMKNRQENIEDAFSWI